MFIGHFAVGFASKRWAPRTSLGLLLAAPLLLDLLWPLFSLVGLQRFRIVPSSNPFTRLTFDSYPWSHSLLMALVWGALLAALYRRGGRSGPRRRDPGPGGHAAAAAGGVGRPAPGARRNRLGVR